MAVGSAAGTPTPDDSDRAAARAWATGVASSLDRRAPWLLGTVALALRLRYAARYATEWDSVQLMIGLDHFDVRVDEPHPPGYWLAVGAGRLVRALTPLDAHASLVLLAAVASATTVAVGYLLGRELRGRWLGWSLGGFLLTAPLLWYYGAVAATYAFDALAGTVIMLLAVRARPGSRHGALAAAALGLAGGFRQSALVLLAPVALVAVGRSVRTWSQLVSATAAGAASVAVWWVPAALEQPGGASVLLQTNSGAWRGAAVRSSWLSGLDHATALRSTLTAVGFTAASVLSLVPPLALAVIAPRPRPPAPPGRGTPLAVLVPALAAVPPLAVAVLVHFGKAGYVLAYLPALAVLMLLPVAGLSARLRAVGTALVVTGVLLSGFRFLSRDGMVSPRITEAIPAYAGAQNGAPFRISAREIDRVDRRTESLVLPLAAAFDPDRDVMAFVMGNGSELYRSAAYYLPRFEVAMLEEGYRSRTSRGRHQLWHFDDVLGIPAGGEAVLVVDRPPAELTPLLAGGQARPVELPTGAVVWAVRPGTRLLGVHLVEEPEGARSRQGHLRRSGCAPGELVCQPVTRE